MSRSDADHAGETKEFNTTRIKDPQHMAESPEANRTVRRTPERLAYRMNRLQAFAAALAEAATPQQIVTIALEQAASAIGASAAAIAIRAPGDHVIEVAGSTGNTAMLWDTAPRLAMARRHPLSDAFRRGHPVFLRSTKAIIARYPEWTERPESSGLAALAAIPLMIDRQAVGAMLLVFASATAFGEQDRAFMLSLARHCAHALERARLFEGERAARADADATRQRLEFVAEASHILATSLDYHATLAAVAKLAVPRIADWCRVDVIEDDGVARPVGLAHVDPAKLQWGRELQAGYPPEPSAAHGISNVLRTGRAEFYSSITDEVLLGCGLKEKHLPMVRQAGLCSLMIVPLTARGRTLGAMTFVSAESQRHYTPADLAFAEDIARRAALAVDNAALYRQAHEAARSKDQAMALLDTLLASAPVGLAFFDRELRCVRVNKALAALHELDATAQLGRRLEEALPEIGEQVAEHLQHVLSSGQPVLNLEVGSRSPGSGSRRDFLASCYPVRSADGELLGVGLVLMDITSRKRVEAEVKQARDEAEAANASKDQFLAVLSHELRTPLTPVLAAASALEGAKGLTAETRSALEMIQRNVELEARLIDDLLDVTRIERGKLQLQWESLDAHELMRQTLEICEANIRAKGLAVSVELRASRPGVRGDRARLQQVLWNLINNAAKFTPRGGHLILRSGNEPDGQLRMDVIDTGIGIESDQMARLFQPFEQGDQSIGRRFGGLGLGLTISKKLVEAHGGKLSVTSAGRNRGAMFSVTLPKAEAPDAARQRPANAPSAAAPHRKLRILLVEDHDDTVRIMCRLLKMAGYEVTTATTLAEAMEASSAADFDLVISDIGLPDGSGLDLMKHLRDRGGIKGIALSGFGMDQDIARSRDVGFLEHLTKPISFQRLEAVIRRVTEEAGTEAK